jgi:hypothetical protein
MTGEGRRAFLQGGFAGLDSQFQQILGYGSVTLARGPRRLPRQSIGKTARDRARVWRLASGAAGPKS